METGCIAGGGGRRPRLPRRKTAHRAYAHFVIYIYIYMYVCVYMYIYIYIHICIYRERERGRDICIDACMYMKLILLAFVLVVHIYIYNMYIHISLVLSLSLYIYMYAYISLPLSLSLYIYIYNSPSIIGNMYWICGTSESYTVGSHSINSQHVKLSVSSPRTTASSCPLKVRISQQLILSLDYFLLRKGTDVCIYIYIYTHTVHTYLLIKMFSCLFV